jgi:peptidyl-prolyl cis-trans isomerase SurA
MKPMKTFSAVVSLFILVVLCPLGVASGEICNRVVAIVNSDVITLYELNNKIKELTGLKPTELMVQDEKGYQETRSKILDLLIDEKIAREKIRDLGITMSPREVDEAIEGVKKDNSLTQEELIASLKQQGISYESYRENMKNELERMRLINFEVKSKIIIREEKIREYYNEHRNEFRNEEVVRLSTIFLGQEDPSDQAEVHSLHQKAKEILLRLENGEDFGRLARETSKGPGAEEGGDLGFFKTSQLDPDIAMTIKDMSVGEVKGPIIRPSGIQIIRLEERQESRVRSLDEVRDTIYSILYRQEIDNRYSSWIKDLREKAYTKILF